MDSIHMPTNYSPGTKEKIALLRLRAELEMDLHVEGDSLAHAHICESRMAALYIKAMKQAESEARKKSKKST